MDKEDGVTNRSARTSSAKRPRTDASGYGSPESMEAACEVHVIWSRSTPPMRSIIGGLMDGKSQVDLATEMKMDRFRVARMIKTLEQKFANAA
jgi:RNA polymerase sigma-70 factor (ECF subfamily)